MKGCFGGGQNLLIEPYLLKRLTKRLYDRQMGADEPADGRVKKPRHLHGNGLGPRQPFFFLGVDHLLGVPLSRADHTWRVPY